MTILVDAAIWPWRGQRWAHLASDTSLEELHRFTADLGVRRLAFGGDHYDINTAERAAALGAGAVPVDARRIVHALRSSGLRCHPPHKAWSWIRLAESRATDVEEISRLQHRVPPFEGGRRPALGERQWRVATAIVTWAPGTVPVDVVVLDRRDERAIVVSSPRPADPALVTESVGGIDGLVHRRTRRGRTTTDELIAVRAVG